MLKGAPAGTGKRISSNKTRIKTIDKKQEEVKELKSKRISSNKTRIKTKVKMLQRE